MFKSTALTIALVGSPAHAMLPPCEYDNLVRAADTVVQITGITVEHGQVTTDCVVTGAVVKVLRGSLEKGDVVTVVVACEWDGMVGGTIYHDRAGLEAAQMIELHLSDGQVAAYGAGLNIMNPDEKGRITHQWNCDG
jgi:hypothetical protein